MRPHASSAHVQAKLGQSNILRVMRGDVTLVFKYSYPVFHLAISNMAQRHVAFCERHVALHVRHVALQVRHVALLIFRQ